MSKFNVRVDRCTGAVVIGDEAKLTIGPQATDGKFEDFLKSLLKFSPRLRSSLP